MVPEASSPMPVAPPVEAPPVEEANPEFNGAVDEVVRMALENASN